MYERYFGLSAKPFSLLPESNHLFASARHQKIVDLLEYGVETQAGFIVITGEVGAGKTTVIRHFMGHLPRNIVLGLITNPSKRLGSLLSWVCAAFDLKQHDRDEAKMYNAFVEFLVAQYAKGRRTVLIIDEAQNLTPDILEELRMLSNVNNEQDHLLQVILSGQPELLDSLNRHELRQFSQRIGVHGHLSAMTPRETAEYIAYRLEIAGATRPLFDERACAAVYFYTHGTPRLINMLCDQSLMYAFAEDKASVTAPIVIEAVSDRNSTGLSPYRKLEEATTKDEIDNRLSEITKVIFESDKID